MKNKQRVIKFRAWDKTNKKIYPIYRLERAIVTYDIPTKDNEPWTGMQVSRKDCVLMQFTGLKDKNGKEIYEGDVVERKVKAMEGFKRMGLAKSRRFRGQVLYLAPEYWVKGIVYPEKVEDHWELNNLHKVIGDIYKNPELIK